MASKDNKNGSQVMLDTLQRLNVDVCWGLPGGAILPFYDELYKSSLKHILVRHEQAAVHAAEGYAKVCGKTGVCIATSGPGATNLLTGLADAKMDSVPVLAITGQVATSAIGTDAFQEVDTFGMSIPITKYNSLLKNANDVARVTEEAMVISQAKRPGAVLIDFPKDIQVQETNIFKAKELQVDRHHLEPVPLSGELDKFIDFLNRAQKPLLYVGGGAIISGASSAILKLAEKAQIPVVTTLMGLGSFPGTHNLSLGMLGMHGTAYANKAVIETDMIIALGARFDDRVAGDPNLFAAHAIKAQIDIDASEIGKRVGIDVYVQGDLVEALEAIIPKVKKISQRPWVKRIELLKKENPLRFNEYKSFIKPQKVIHRMWEKTAGKAIIVTDVGQHQMWAAQYYLYDKPRKFVTSGGLGTMGFGYPAALGAKEAAPNEEVILVTGDGSFQMCLQELATAKMYNIKVKILLFNNGFLGMVRQWQELFYDNRFAESTMEYNPNFVKLANAYDIEGKRIESNDEIEAGLDFLLNTDDSCILEVAIPQSEKVYPMISTGDSYEQMIDFDPNKEAGEATSLFQ